MRLQLLAIVLGAAFLMPGCQTAPTPHAASIPTKIDDTLSPGDTLRITFVGAPELSQAQRIRSDGKITLPRVGEFQASGKRPTSLQAQLISAYKGTLQNPELTVFVESSTFPVIVLGAVGRPGEVNLDRPSLLQAIGKAGGVTRGLGDASKIRIIHEGEKENSARVVNLDAVLRGKSSQIIYLQRGDTIIVPEKWL